MELCSASVGSPSPVCSLVDRPLRLHGVPTAGRQEDCERHPKGCDRDVGLMPDRRLPLQAVWNHVGGFPAGHGIIGYGIPFCDLEDLSREGEYCIVRHCESTLAELGDDVQLRNQAGAHPWYPEKLGAPHKVPRRTLEGIDNFLHHCSLLRPRKTPDGYEHIGIQRRVRVGTEVVDLDCSGHQWVHRGRLTTAGSRRTTHCIVTGDPPGSGTGSRCMRVVRLDGYTSQRKSQFMGYTRANRPLTTYPIRPICIM